MRICPTVGLPILLFVFQASALINQIEFDVQGLLLCMLLLQAEMWIVA